MKAYKIWYDEPHYIHKDTTNDLNLKWTTDVTQAKDVSTYEQAVDFFFNKLDFSLNLSIPDPLYLLKDENA